MQTSYFGHFGHITQIQNDSMSLQKSSMSSLRWFTSFLRYYISKNYATWSAFWPITREPEFFQVWDWWWNINNNISFHFRLFPRNTNDKIFQEKPILGPFWAFFPNLGKKEFFLKKESLSVFKYSNYLPTSRKSFKFILKTKWPKFYYFTLSFWYS